MSFFKAIDWAIHANLLIAVVEGLILKVGKLSSLMISLPGLG